MLNSHLIHPQPHIEKRKWNLPTQKGPGCGPQPRLHDLFRRARIHSFHKLFLASCVRVPLIIISFTHSLSHSYHSHPFFSGSHTLLSPDSFNLRLLSLYIWGFSSQSNKYPQILNLSTHPPRKQQQKTWEVCPLQNRSVMVITGSNVSFLIY